MAKKPQRGARNRDANPRKFKKKTSPLVIEKVEYVDYKDVDLLTRFMSDRGKIRGKHLSGNDVQQQREVANAIKIAREMGTPAGSRRLAVRDGAATVIVAVVQLTLMPVTPRPLRSRRPISRTMT